LSDEEKKDATLLYQSLKLASEMWRENIFDVAIIKKQMTALLEKSPLINIECIGVSDPVTLEELSLMSKGTLVSIAARIGKARLIDNITLGD
jgi:pantoate--beta-alanine ligase